MSTKNSMYQWWCRCLEQVSILWNNNEMIEMQGVVVSVGVWSAGLQVCLLAAAGLVRGGREGGGGGLD